MTLLNRFYRTGLMIMATTLAILMLKPMLIVFILTGLLMSYVIHYIIKHPAWSHLVARVLAECVGLMLVLAFFVSLVVIYSHLITP
jgi:hypothetical protein